MNKQCNSSTMDTWKPLSQQDLTNESGKLMPVHDVGRYVSGLMIRNLLQNAETRMLKDKTAKMRHPLTGRVIKINGPSYLKLLDYMRSHELQEYILVLNKQGYWVAQNNDWVEDIKPKKKKRWQQPKIGKY